MTKKKAQVITNSSSQPTPFRNMLPERRGALPIERTMQRMENASFAGTSGAQGYGDRGSWQSVPTFTDNPYDSNDYIYRWRQYCHLYEVSWEARKIVRIPVEDALRKPWIAEGINETIAEGIWKRLEQLQFIGVLKRSLMLERLLGGCLTFLGLDSDQDDTSKIYHPFEGSRLRFCNPIPISRISRTTWDTNPLHESYMRPDMYMVNGQDLHVSRCLIWDGEPLFDPYDFALTNFRSNLAGFGPSKLAPIWDDIVKAVGTRQAAYQLIQVNNSILVAVQDLQDLQGTDAGAAAVQKMKNIADQLSLYRAALIDGDKVNVTQSAASFGSVPELIITFIQILSAASDIPATRFLGQAPGGLNATGESDLENYYNVIDAYQHQRIKPALIRMYDIVGFQMYPTHWKEERKKLDFKFPPLWNLSELEEAELRSKDIDNIIKLRGEGLISDIKCIQELNQKNALGVTLEEDDIQLLGSVGEEEPVDAGAEIQRLRNAVQVGDIKTAWADLITRAGGDPAEVNIEQFQKGFSVEQEHDDITHGDRIMTAKIVLDHLREAPDYYSKLERVENAKQIWDVEFYVRGTSDKLKIQVAAETEEQAKALAREGVKQNGGGVAFTLSKVNNSTGEYYVERGMLASNSAFTQAQREVAIHSQAATSPFNSLQATEAQIQAGNYKKPKVRVHGFNIAIENPAGSVRKGVDERNKIWETTMPHHYGYILGTVGADKGHVDCFIGPDESAPGVFVIDQLNLKTGEFDEHKVLFGFPDEESAKSGYLAAYDESGPSRIGAFSQLDLPQFKEWLLQGDMTQPLAITNGAFRKIMEWAYGH